MTKRRTIHLKRQKSCWRKQEGFLLKLTIRFMLFYLISANPALYEVVVSVPQTIQNLDCSSPNIIYIHAMRYIHTTPDPISFNLIDYSQGGAPTPPEFIVNPENGQAQFAMYELGSTCYMLQDHTGANSKPLIVLVIGSAGVGNACKVARIITKKAITPCSGSYQTLGDLFTFEGEAGNDQSFKTLNAKPSPKYFYSETRLYEILNFGLNDIDERIVEISTSHSIFRIKDESRTYQWSYTVPNRIKVYISKNPFAALIKPSSFIPRLFRDDLPGYYLGVYFPSSQNHDAYYQEVEESRSKEYITRSMHLQMYMSTPDSFTIGKEHTIEITSKPYQIKAAHPGLAIEYHYLIKISRTSSSMIFKYYRGPSTQVGSLSLNYPSSGTGNKFVYFSLTVGHGMLFFKDSSTFRSRRYQTLHVYQPATGIKLRDHQTLDEDMTEQQMRPDKNGIPTSLIWTKIEYKPAAGITSNEASIRVFISTMTGGVYPPFLFSSRAANANDRCYFESILPNCCLANGFLLDGSETQAPRMTRFDNIIFSPPEKFNFKQTCKVMSDMEICLIPKPGYITNLEKRLRTGLYPILGRIRCPISKI